MSSPLRAHLVCSITTLGIVIVLFFQCMGALLNPVNRARGGIKWGLVAHTAAMFSFVTIYTAMTLDIQSISYIDNRDFPGDGEVPSRTSWIPVPHLLEGDQYRSQRYVPLEQLAADGLLVSSVSNPVAQVSNVGRHSSSIVATLSMP
jgi:hypothetical protein